MKIPLEVQKSIQYLDTKYTTQTVLLYGSFSQGTNNEDSDIDLMVFADVAEKTHESAKIEGHVLDAWIYPKDMIDDVSLYIHIYPFFPLKDNLSIAGKIESRILEERRVRTKPLDSNARKQLSAWIDKMIQRSESNTTESNYRYNWLLNDFPELYCSFLGIYYDGPVKFIVHLRNTDHESFKMFNELLEGGKNTKLLKTVYERIRK